MKNFLESLNDIFSANYYVFFENDVEGSGPWMVSDRIRIYFPKIVGFNIETFKGQCHKII